MTANRGALAAVGLAGALAFGMVGRAEAQSLAPAAPPLFGMVQARGGVAPDPLVVDGVAGGRVDLSRVNSSCRGYASEAPSHVVMTPTGLRFLAIMVNGSFDSTLLVQTPDGQIYCNDDTDGLQPRVEITSVPGPIRIWVGSYSSSSGGAYRLGLSNSPGVRGAQLGMPGAGMGGGVVVAPPQQRPGGIIPNAPAVYGDVRLRSGSRSDPMIITGNAGGPIDATSVGGNCRGWVTPQPTHMVMAQSGFRNLRFVVHATHDTTLVVQFPDGRIACDDDGGGSLNPVVEGPTGPGPIRVWVGSYGSGRTGPYTLGLTENPNITPEMIGRGGVGSVVVTPPQGQPPQGLPPQPPPGAVTMVDLMPRIPITLFGPGMTTATMAVWSPRGGPRVELGVAPAGNSLRVSARIGGQEIPLVSVPADIARDAVVTVMQRPRDMLLLRAERAPGGRDPGAQMLLLVRWSGGTAEVAEQWVGTASERGPRWAR